MDSSISDLFHEVDLVVVVMVQGISWTPVLTHELPLDLDPASAKWFELLEHRGGQIFVDWLPHGLEFRLTSERTKVIIATPRTTIPGQCVDFLSIPYISNFHPLPQHSI